MRLGLVVALPEEVRALRRVIPDARCLETGTRDALRDEDRGMRDEDQAGIPHPSSLIPRPLSLYAGTMGGQPVMIAAAGAGARGAERAAAALLERGAETLLAAGFAGALSSALQPGDLLAATEILGPDGARWPAPAAWAAAFAAAGEDGGRRAATCGRAGPSTIMARADRRPPGSWRVHQGPLVTTARVVTAAAEKRRLGEETGALAVDMESAAVARCAAAAGVPMAAVRAITDGVHESLPLDFELCFDPDGQFHYTCLIGLLARRPLAVGSLLRLGQNSARAGQALASFLVSILPHLPRFEPRG